MQKTRKKIIIACICSLASIGAFFGARMGIAHIQSTTTLLAQQLSASSSHAYSESILEREAKDSAEKRAMVDTYFLTTSSVAPFLEQIETLAKTAGVALVVDSVAEDTRTVAGAKKPETYGVVVFTTSFEGAWQDVYRFLSLLEHIPYASRIERVSLEQISSTENTKAGFGWKGVVVFSIAKL